MALTGTSFTSDMGIDDIKIWQPPDNDAGVTEIDYPVNPAITGWQPIHVTFKNFGALNLTSADVMYSVNGILQDTLQWTGLVAPGMTADSIQIDTFNFLQGGNYIKAWTANPNGQVDGFAYNDTATSSIVACTGPLSGVYTVGGSTPDYADIATAFYALLNCGIDSHVVFNVKPGTYTGQLSLSTVIGAADTATITFQSSTGNPADVMVDYSGASSTTDNWVLQLNGADYVTFRGITFKSTNSSNYGGVIQLDNAATNNLFEDCNIVSNGSTSSYARGVYSYNTLNHYTTFRNCNVTDAYYGFYVRGTSSASSGLVKGFTVENCSITDFYYYGMYFYYQDSVQIIGNYIKNGSGSAAYPRGIYAYYCDGMKQIVGNTIELSPSSYAYGIYDYYNDGISGKPGIIANNFISINGGTSAHYGLYLYSSTYQKIAHNSININGGSTTSYAFRQYGSASNIDVVNNNFVSNSGYAYYVNTPTAINVSDNNNIYSTGSNFAYWSGASSNLSALQSASGKDASSVSVDPGFLSATDLHINNVTLDGAGMPLTYVTVDIDGEPRDSLTPDIGADEYMLVTDDAGIFAMTEPVTACPGDTTDIKVELKNFGTDTLFSATIKWTMNGVMQDSAVYNDTLLPGASADVLLATYVFAAGVPHDMVFWSENPNGIADLQTTNDTLAVLGFKTALPAGTYTIGSSTSADYATFVAAIADLNQFGICGPVVFNVETGTYNESVVIDEVLGASSVNTITFQSATGNNTDVTLSATSGVILKLDGADYITIKDMTISGAGATSAIEIANGANYNTIQGNILSLTGSNTSSTYRVVYDYNSINEFNSYIDNTVSGGYYGMYFYGGGTTSLQKGTHVEGNDISGFYIYGMFVYYQDSAQVIGNYIHDGTNSYCYGIYTYYNFNGFSFSKNRIILDNSSYCYALRVYYGNYYLYMPTNAAPGLVSNNFISVSAGTGTIYGIYAYYSNNVKYYHNSVHISAGGTSSRCLYQYNTPSNTYGQTFYNNTFSNTGGGYAAYYSSTTYINDVDYNNYYTTGSYLAYWNGNRADLSALQSASSKDANSVSVDPQFVSDTDLHTNNISLWGAGMPLSTIVPDDIDDEPRDTVAPCIGADEFDVLPYNAQASVLWTLGKLPKDAASPHTVKAVVQNMGQNSLPDFDVILKVVGINSFTDTVTIDTLFQGMIDTVEFAPYSPTNYGNTTVRVLLPPDDDNTDNIAEYMQVVTDTVFGYADTSAKVTNLGFNTGEGFFLTRYTMNGSKVINAVNAYITNSGTLGQVLYGVVLDTAGNVLATSQPDTIDASEQESWVTFPIDNVQATATVNSDFYVGFAQTASSLGYHPCGVQEETPGRPEAFYYASGLTGGGLIEDASFGRFMIEAVIGDPGNKDATASQFTHPVADCGMTASEIVALKVLNTGTDTIFGGDSTLQATYVVVDNNGSPLLPAVTEYVFDTIPPASGVDHSFAVTVNMVASAADSSFNFKGWIDYTGDPFAANDTVSVSMISPKTPLDPTVVSPITVQYGTSTTLSAIPANAADSLFWFDSLISQNPVGQGVVYNTPVLFNTTTFYVQAGGVGKPDSIETIFSGGNGQNGNMFDITAYNNFTIDSFAILPNTTGTHTVEVYYKSGTYLGSENNASAWTLLGQATVTGGGTAVPSSLCVADIGGLQVQAGQTYGIYVTLTSGSVHYTNGTGSNQTFTNTDMQITAGAGIAYPFSSNFTPRVFNGKLFYSSGVGGCASSRVPLVVNTTMPPPDDAGVYMVNSPVGSTTSNVPTDIIVQIKNYGTDSLYSAVVNWTLNGTAKSPYSWTGALAPDSISAPVVIATDTFMGGVYCMDVWTTMPNSVADTVNFNDTAYNCFNACLSGTYTLGGTNADFPTFLDARNALDSAGICGAVVFLVDSGMYNVGQLEFKEISGASAVNTVTFRGATGDSTDVVVVGAGTSSSSNYVIYLNDADYMRFEKMTFKTTATSYSTVFYFDNGADHNILSNNVIEGQALATSSYARTVYIYYNGGNHYNELWYNRITGGYYGIYNYGYSSLPKQGTVIYGNEVDGFYYYGMYNYYQDSLVLRNNTIINGSNSSYPRGMYNYYCNNEFEAIGNKILLTPTSYGYGMYVYYSSGSASSPGTIANNFIAIDGGTSTNYGFYVYNSTYRNFYHNNVNIAGGSTYSRCIYQLSGSNLRFVNNNMVNTGGGYTYYVYTPTAIMESDNNNLYATGSYLAYWNSVSHANLAALQNSSGMDTNSISVDPGYLSNTDLHVSTFDLNAAAKPGTGITVDIDGDPRNATMPDIGADEFDPPAKDAGIVSIDSPTNPAVTGSQSVLVTLRNFGLDTLNNVTINWTVNGVPQTGYAWTGTLATGLSQSNVNIGTYNFTVGQNQIKAWVTNPNGAPDQWAYNDTVEVTIIACTGPLSGTYTIGGTTPDYTTFTAALSALVNCGIGGPVTFNVAAGNYPEQLTVDTIPGASATNTITFQGATGDSTDVILNYGASSTADNWVVYLNGADYVAFKHMTIKSTATGNYGRVVVIENGAEYCEFSNNVIESVTATSSYACPVYSSGSNDNYFILRNNNILNGYYGLYLRGSSTSSLEMGDLIEGNSITGWYYYGAYLYGHDAIQFRGNFIENGPNTGYCYGLYLYYVDNDMQIVGNEIHTHGSSTNYAMRAYYCDGTALKPGLVANNFITVSGSTSSTTYGVYHYNSHYTNYIYNSINVAAGSTSSSRAFYISGSSSSGTGDVSLLNNILANTAGGYTYYVASNYLLVSDYNNLYATGANLAYLYGSVTTLPMWVMNSGMDSNSVSVDPGFVTDMDLHVVSSAMNGIAYPAPLVIDDIDGDIRDTLNPDIGADEFDPLNLDLGVTAFLEPSATYSAVGSLTDVKILIRNYGIDTVSNFQVGYQLPGQTANMETYTDTLYPNMVDTFLFTNKMNPAAGQFNFCAFTGLVGDQKNINDTICMTYTGVPVFPTPYATDFEGTINYWFRAGGTAEWEFGIPNGATIGSAHSPVNAWVTDLNDYYSNSAVDYLYTPKFDLSQYGIDSLKFWHRFETELNNDGGRIQYLNIQGNWETLGTTNDTNASNWYNTFQSNIYSWTGSSSGWMLSTYDLSAVTDFGAITQFRFVFSSNTSNNAYDGWAVDDFEVTIPKLPEDAGVIAVHTPTDTTALGSTVTVSVDLHNFGTDTLFTIPVKYFKANNPPVAETWTGTLPPNQTTVFTFATHYIAPITNYNFCAWSDVTNDTYFFNDSTCKYIVAQLQEYDAGVSDILNPHDSTLINQNYQVTVRVKNYGLYTLSSLPITYVFRTNPPVTENWTGSLAPGDSVDYTFTTPYNSTLLIGNYSLCAYSEHINGVYHMNDTVCYNLVNYIGITEHELENFWLGQNIPNPANDLAIVNYGVPNRGEVRFTLVNMIGEIMYNEIIDASAGMNKIELDVSNIADGIYYYAIEYKEARLVKKMIINK